MRNLTPEENKAFIDECLKRNGCWYVWPAKSNRYSGKDLDNALFPNTYDCSGLVTSSLFSAIKLDYRATKNAQMLCNDCDAVNLDDIKPGDLIFYGASPSHVSHVMVYIGVTNTAHWYRPIYGSSGGDSRTISVEEAKIRNAKVRSYKNINYRLDFVCVGRLRIPNAKVR
jgi:cell wall-associated NlpC family hydrolase